MTSINIKSEKVEQCLAEPRWWGAQAQLSDGKIIIAGGNISDPASEKKEKAIAGVELIDPLTCTSEDKGNLLEAMRGTQAVQTPSQVYFFGGRGSPQVESYTPGGGFAAMGFMQQSRSGSAQILLPDGKILITGGYDMSPANRGILSSAEVFDPTTKQSLAVGSMSFARAGHSITNLGNGQYLMIGGKNESATKTEIYDSAAQSFSPGPNLNFGRKDHQAVADGNGRIWILGGTGPDGKSVKEIEYYDPSTKSFVVANRDNTPLSLGVGREDLAATYLPELGVIVAIGGEIKGTMTADGLKDPASNDIDVIDVTTMSVKSAKLLLARDEATIAVVNPNPNDLSVSLVLLQGVGQNHLPVQVERVTISRD